MPLSPKDLIRPEIQALSAYPVPASHNMIKLDAMENPYGWPEALRAAWLDELATAPINRYPDAQASEVKAQLRSLMGIPDKYELMLGNGSDEIIQIVAQAIAGSDRVVMAPEPSFVMFRMIATFVNVRFVGVPLNADFSLDTEAMLAALRKESPGVLFLAQPNNPTGNLYDAAAVKAILDAAPGLVVIDEAYMAFTDEDHLPLLDQYPNLLIMRTLSKVGLAGLRLGLLIGRHEWMQEFEKIRLPYNINVLTQRSVAFALRHYDALREQTQRLRDERECLMTSLRSMALVEVFPSEANFVLVRCAATTARPVFEQLKTQGVLIKCLDGAHPLLADCLRLTVGAPAENDQMLAALKVALQQG